MGPLNVSSISRRHWTLRPWPILHLRNDVGPSLPYKIFLNGRGPRGELIIANIYSGLVTARSGEWWGVRAEEWRDGGFEATTERPARIVTHSRLIFTVHHYIASPSSQDSPLLREIARKGIFFLSFFLLSRVKENGDGKRGEVHTPWHLNSSRSRDDISRHAVRIIVLGEPF